MHPTVNAKHRCLHLPGGLTLPGRAFNSLRFEKFIWQGLSRLSFRTCFATAKLPVFACFCNSGIFVCPFLTAFAASAQVLGATGPWLCATICGLSFMGWFRLDENLKHLRTLATAVLKMLFTMSYVSLILDVKLPGRQESSVSRRSSAGVLVESEWYVMDRDGCFPWARKGWYQDLCVYVSNEASGRWLKLAYRAYQRMQQNIPKKGQERLTNEWRYIFELGSIANEVRFAHMWDQNTGCIFAGVWKLTRTRRATCVFTVKQPPKSIKDTVNSPGLENPNLENEVLTSTLKPIRKSK